MRIRAAVNADLPRLIDIEQQMFTPSDGRLSKRQFAYHLKAGNKLWVAVNQAEQISGYLLVFYYKHSLRVYSIAVAKAFQRQGIANALMTFALALAQQQVKKQVLLEVRESNQAALSLYQKLGFRLHRRKTAYYADGETALQLYCLA